jgi:CCR4-NOT transcriptional regulation complex NOT5 subunit
MNASDLSEFDGIIRGLGKQAQWDLSLLFCPEQSTPQSPSSGSSSSSITSLEDSKLITKKRRVRQRSANVEDLVRCGMYDNHQDPDLNILRMFIRQWKNERGMKFYDCCCGKRRAVQDLHKLRRHIRSIHNGIWDEFSNILCD